MTRRSITSRTTAGDAARTGLTEVDQLRQKERIATGTLEQQVDGRTRDRGAGQRLGHFSYFDAPESFQLDSARPKAAEQRPRGRRRAPATPRRRGLVATIASEAVAT